MLATTTLPGVRAATCHPSNLAADDVAVWRAMIAAEPAFANPLLGPDFAQAVGAVRPEASVTVWRGADGAPVAFLAHQKAQGGVARPIAGPMSDYQALISRREDRLGGGHLLSVAGLAAWRYTALIDPHGVFARPGVEHEAHRIVLDAPTDAAAADYLEAIRAASAKKFKNYRRLGHALEREVGELRMVAPDDSTAAFDQLMTWKREQLARTGVFDFLGPVWTNLLLQTMFDRREGDFRGLMIGLYAGDRLVAGQFGVRQGDYFHPWIASVDPEMSAWSPGQLFLTRAIEAMPELGLRAYDLGPSHDHYKRPYALTQVMVGEGAATARSAAGWINSAVEDAWTLAGGRRGGVVGKVRRRLDAIATTETTASGRVRGLAAAAASLARPKRRGGAEQP
jgi:CelD/BcsL family acetyltransferase involved in cellulose biosynthesis